MAFPLDIKNEEKRITEDIMKLFQIIERHTSTVPTGLSNQAKVLYKLREDIYEDLNQLQHQVLIIEAAKQLRNKFAGKISWKWHPRQTSKPDEADLTGFVKDRIVISAEVTTSMKPVGTIDSRMKTTLISLNRKKGKRFYFVQTDEMFKRASTKISKNKWRIEPRLL